MISVAYDTTRNALYVSGILQPFPAGSLEARQFGDMLAVANPYEVSGHDLVCAWLPFGEWMIEGVVYADAASAFAALTDVCNRKRALGLTYTQASPAFTWVIRHSLNFCPNVSVIDTAGDLCLADIAWPDTATVIISFGAPTAGIAYLS